MSLPLKAHKNIKADLEALPTDVHRINALRLISRLKNHPKLGKPLGYLPSVGDLSSFRKLYFSDRVDKDPDYRIVYCLSPNEDSPVLIYIAGVGEREDKRIYREVERRIRDLEM